MSTLFPWMTAQQQQLQQALRSGRFPATLLIHASAGTGGEELARYVAQLALCRADAPPCGQCTDCRRVLARQHPDFTWVTLLPDSKDSKKESKVIRVDQIRELTQDLTLTAHGGGATVAVISPADAMNASAANSLLKTLEEPRGGVTLVLVTATPSRLPATILSRCLHMSIRAPSREQSLAWLAASHPAAAHPAADWGAVLDVLGEAPLRAVQIDAQEFARLRRDTDDALAQACTGRLEVAHTAENWVRSQQFELRLACVENWLTSRIEGRLRSEDQTPEVRGSTRRVGTNPGMNTGMDTGLLLKLLDGVHELRALRNTQFNRVLILEQLLWQFARDQRAVA